MAFGGVRLGGQGDGTRWSMPLMCSQSDGAVAEGRYNEETPPSEEPHNTSPHRERTRVGWWFIRLVGSFVWLVGWLVEEERKAGP